MDTDIQEQLYELLLRLVLLRMKLLELQLRRFPN